MAAFKRVVKPIGFMLENSWSVRHVPGELIDLDGKVCYMNNKNFLMTKLLDRAMKAASLFIEVDSDKFAKIEEQLHVFVQETELLEQKDGNYNVYINQALAERSSFYTETDDDTEKYDRRLVLSDSPLDGIQQLLGISVFGSAKK